MLRLQRLGEAGQQRTSRRCGAPRCPAGSAAARAAGAAAGGAGLRALAQQSAPLEAQRPRRAAVTASGAVAVAGGGGPRARLARAAARRLRRRGCAHNAGAKLADEDTGLGAFIWGRNRPTRCIKQSADARAAEALKNPSWAFGCSASTSRSR